jgi:hypothetical protein
VSARKKPAVRARRSPRKPSRPVANAEAVGVTEAALNERLAAGENARKHGFAVFTTGVLQDDIIDVITKAREEVVWAMRWAGVEAGGSGADSNIAESGMRAFVSLTMAEETLRRGLEKTEDVKNTDGTVAS